MDSSREGGGMGQNRRGAEQEAGNRKSRRGIAAGGAERCCGCRLLWTLRSMSGSVAGAASAPRRVSPSPSLYFRVRNGVQNGQLRSDVESCRCPLAELQMVTVTRLVLHSWHSSSREEMVYQSVPAVITLPPPLMNFTTSTCERGVTVLQYQVLLVSLGARTCCNSI
ncbi:hypothetical protein K439DRAFT_665282 [Ramaria rubella]|nr:hypothetical protein K439DRAFT_665282 [Ramaria rubella]